MDKDVGYVNVGNKLFYSMIEKLIPLIFQEILWDVYL